MPLNIFLKSDLIYLKPLTQKEVNTSYVSWLNDANICKYNSHHRFPNSINKTIQYVEDINSSSMHIVLAIYDNQSNTHIGNISLQNINYIDSNAELAILIGNSQSHNKGFGCEACELIINHGFNTLNLHRIYCGTSIQNISMQKLAQKLNMKEEGFSKDALFKDGQYFDIINYYILNKVL
jgi:RimJ/RimL family protein N-acetyltransferase